MEVSFLILSFVLLLQVTSISLGLYFKPRAELIQAALTVAVVTIPFVAIGILTLLIV